MASENPPAPAPTPGGGALGTSFRHRFANADYDESQGVLRVDGQAVAVEPRPLQLLAELLRHVNEVVTRDELHELIWERRVPIDNVLPNAVNKLRKALGEAAAAHIVSLPRVGYRLLGPVERMVVGRPDAQALALAAGQAVQGRPGFVLLRPLGAGGRGNVWLARHAKLATDRVFKFAADADGLRSLKREFSLYRLLKAELGERADFAQVLDANFSEEPYHLECAYGGPDLLAWAEASHLQDMTRAQRVDLMCQIAQAVAAAHSVGVLHKDLKPANILMGGEPGAWQPQLTDFGSGHAIEPERLRQLGLTAMGLTVTQGVSADTTLGTAMYLAPEVQAGQASTVQSDLYALGLMLYQLLAGDLRKPMSTGWQRDVDDELLCEDIAAATEGQPQARLGSVSALVERLVKLEVRRSDRLFRLDEAQRAAAALAEQQRRSVRRPWAIAALVSLVIGLGASIAFGVKTTEALTQAQEESTRAGAINNFMQEDFLSEIDVQYVAAAQTVSIVELLKRSSLRAGKRFSGMVEVEVEVRVMLGRMYSRLSMLAEEEAELVQALSLIEKRPVAVSATLRNRVRASLAETLATRGKVREAQALLQKIEPDVKFVRGRSAAIDAIDLARAEFTTLYMQDKFADALVPGTRMVALSDELPAGDLIVRFANRFVFADLLFRTGQYDQARAMLATLLKPPYDSTSVGEVMVARARISRARVEFALGNHTAIESELSEARDVLLGLTGERDYYVAIANAELSSFYESRSDFLQAMELGRRALAGFTLSVGEGNTATRIVALNLAIIEQNTGNSASALARLESGRAWFVESTGGEQGRVVQSIDFERARALTSLGRPAEAIALLSKLDHKRLAEATPGLDWEWRLQAERGRALIANRQFDAGKALVQSALPKMDETGTAEWVKAGYRKLISAKSK